MTRRESIARFYKQEFYVGRCRDCTSATQHTCPTCIGTGRALMRREMHPSTFRRFISQLKGLFRWSN